MDKREKGWIRISTYVDDFLITAEELWVYMIQLQRTYKIKDPKPPENYLGATYAENPKGKWSITAKGYIKEAIRQIEKRLEFTIREEKIPMKNDDHREEDDSEVLENKMRRLYQTIIGMLQWTVSLCRIDICYAVLQILFMSKKRAPIKSDQDLGLSKEIS
jgi:hypothetical protein